MIPFGNEIVTLIKRTETVINGKTAVSYSKHTLSGCSWRRRATRFLNDTDAMRREEITCRIPVGQIEPQVGDCLFLGRLDIAISDAKSLVDALEKHKSAGAMRITSISDNSRPGLPLRHIAARGG